MEDIEGKTALAAGQQDCRPHKWRGVATNTNLCRLPASIASIQEGGVIVLIRYQASSGDTGARSRTWLCCPAAVRSRERATATARETVGAGLSSSVTLALAVM